MFTLMKRNAVKSTRRRAVKPAIVQFRCSRELHNALCELADQQRRKLSDLTRIILEDAVGLASNGNGKTSKPL
jgi:hypothetical protein